MNRICFHSYVLPLEYQGVSILETIHISLDNRLQSKLFIFHVIKVGMGSGAPFMCDALFNTEKAVWSIQFFLRPINNIWIRICAGDLSPAPPTRMHYTKVFSLVFLTTGIFNKLDALLSAADPQSKCIMCPGRNCNVSLRYLKFKRISQKTQIVHKLIIAYGKIKDYSIYPNQIIN